ncbi:MAG: hypothetical protein ACI8YQ_003027 [Polaribacter sp.]|jgi:hypothetical protein
MIIKKIFLFLAESQILYVLQENLMSPVGIVFGFWYIVII